MTVEATRFNNNERTYGNRVQRMTSTQLHSPPSSAFQIVSIEQQKQVGVNSFESFARSECPQHILTNDQTVSMDAHRSEKSTMSTAAQRPLIFTGKGAPSPSGSKAFPMVKGTLSQIPIPQRYCRMKSDDQQLDISLDTTTCSQHANEERLTIDVDIDECRVDRTGPIGDIGDDSDETPVEFIELVDNGGDSGSGDETSSGNGATNLQHQFLTTIQEQPEEDIDIDNDNDTIELQ